MKPADVTEADTSKGEQVWLDPTPEMLDTILFDVIWCVIKTWDVNVPHAYHGYCGATGNHARAIYDAVAPLLQSSEAHRIAAFEAGRVAGLEEAAKVADEVDDKFSSEWCAGLKASTYLEGQSDGAGCAAEAIRALKEKSNG